jgi:cytoskeletal protein CcmA (bactofilin family)
MFGKENGMDKLLKLATLTDNIPSIISPNTHVEGIVRSDGQIEVHGKIQGEIKCKILVIKPGGSVVGEVLSEYIKIHGSFNGKIKTNVLHVGKTGVVSAEIRYGIASIEFGADVTGQCTHVKELVNYETNDPNK